MEFAIKYHEVQSIYELYPDWHKQPDPNANFFTIFGYSYLEVGFNFVCKQGRDIIDILQNSYLENKKGGKRPYVRLDPFIFLNKTPEVDDLEINPEPDNELDSKPDMIIKTWFDNMMKGTKSEFKISDYSRQSVKAKFNSIEMQLEHELKKTSAGDKPGDKSKPLVPVPIPIPVFSAGGGEIRTESERLDTGHPLDLTKLFWGHVIVCLSRFAHIRFNPQIHQKPVPDNLFLPEMPMVSIELHVFNLYNAHI